MLGCCEQSSQSRTPAPAALERAACVRGLRQARLHGRGGGWVRPLWPECERGHAASEVWVSETKALVAVGGTESADLGLRTGRGPWPGVSAEALMSEELIPVAAPALAARLNRPADLARARLLHDEDPRAGWPEWLQAAGLGRPAWAERGPRLADGTLLLEAARAGQGVALARRRLAAAHLGNRSLVQPFGP